MRLVEDPFTGAQFDYDSAAMSPEYRARLDAALQAGSAYTLSTPTFTPAAQSGIIPAIISAGGSILGGILGGRIQGAQPPIQVEAPPLPPPPPIGGYPPVTTSTGVNIPSIGYHGRGHTRRMVWSSRLGMYVPAHRRMNVLNPRALKRAMRRVEGFAHFAKRTISFTKRVHMKKRRKH